MRIHQTLRKFARKFPLILLLIATIFCCWSPPAFAHRPHDVIEQVEVSPDFEVDKTVYIFVRNNLYKSIDGGENWSRQIQGLDYKGEISSLSISPLKKNILYLASRSDGMYKSEDEGESWRKVNQGLETEYITLVKIAPSSIDTAIAVGKDKGLYLTQNGGGSWSNIFKTPAPITDAVISPQNPDEIIFGDDKGNLFLSLDAGKTWQTLALPKEAGVVNSIAISPNSTTDKTFFIGTNKGGIFKTVDLGKSFESIDQDIEDKSIEDIVVSQNYAKDATIYASTWYDGMYVSKDGGKSWKKMSEGLTKDHQADDFKVPHFIELKVVNQTMFLGGFNGLFKTTDGGQNWRELETLSKGTVVALAVSPNYEKDSTVAIATYVGNIFISRDKGETWTPINRGLERFNFEADKEEATQDPRRFFDIEFSPNYGADKTIFASILWSKIVRTENSGESWKIVDLSQAVRGIKIAPSPNFAIDRTVYLTNQPGKIFLSTDGGNSFTYSDSVGKIIGNGPPSMVISPDFANDRTIFTAGKGGIYRHFMIQGVASWKNMTEGTPLADAAFVQLAISPNYKVDGTVFAGTGKGLFATRDRGETWTRMENPSFPADSSLKAVALSPDYANDKTLILSLQGRGLYKSVDGGKTFQSIGDPKLPILKIDSVPSAGIPIRFSPNYANDRTLFGFGGTKTNVYRSTDGGETWTTATIPTNVEDETARYKVSEFFGGPLGKIWRVVIPILLAVGAYVLAGYLKLEKKIAFNKLAIRMLAAFLIFLISFVVIAQF